jgi:hypothetical protein
MLLLKALCAAAFVLNIISHFLHAGWGLGYYSPIPVGVGCGKFRPPASGSGVTGQGEVSSIVSKLHHMLEVDKR